MKAKGCIKPKSCVLVTHANCWYKSYQCHKQTIKAAKKEGNFGLEYGFAWLYEIYSPSMKKLYFKKYA